MTARRGTSVHKGRGALSNASGRFEQVTRERFDDGWNDGRDERRARGREGIGRERDAEDGAERRERAREGDRDDGRDRDGGGSRIPPSRARRAGRDRSRNGNRDEDCRDLSSNESSSLRGVGNRDGDRDGNWDNGRTVRQDDSRHGSRDRDWDGDRDGDWDGYDLPPPKLRTTLTPDATRTIIARNDSPDLPFDRSINPYRGCEHGCIYCYARPTHAYLGLSPGLDFETRLVFKPEAAALLRAELGRPGYACAPIALGTNTDPYQPVERDLGITRAVLEVLAECGHPVTIVTKSARVERDIDILGAMAKANRCSVAVSVTTLDRALARRMEPRASAPHRRLETVRRLSRAGIPTGVMAAPMIPFLNDAELEAILEQAREAGALGASYTMLRLPLEIADLFREWLAEHCPDRAGRVMERVRDTRGGKDYDSTFGQRMRGTGPVAELLAKRFRLAVKRLGFPGFPALDCSGFVPPAPERGQLSLF